MLLCNRKCSLGLCEFGKKSKGQTTIYYKEKKSNTLHQFQQHWLSLFLLIPLRAKQSTALNTQTSSKHLATQVDTYSKVKQQCSRGPAAVTLFTVRIWRMHSSFILLCKASVSKNVHISSVYQVMMDRWLTGKPFKSNTIYPCQAPGSKFARRSDLTSLWMGCCFVLQKKLEKEVILCFRLIR